LAKIFFMIGLGIIIGALLTGVTRMYNVGQNIIQGLWNGMKAVWEKLAEWLRKTAAWVELMWRKITHTQSPSADMYGVGVDLMAGLAGGMKKGYESVSSFVSSSAPINPDPYGGEGDFNSNTMRGGWGSGNWGNGPTYGGGGGAGVAQAVSSAIEQVASVIVAALPAVTAAAAEAAAAVATSTMSQSIMDSQQAQAEMRRTQTQQNVLLTTKLNELIAAVRSGATDHGVAMATAEAMQFADFG
jgi:hypothetical protein